MQKTADLINAVAPLRPFGYVYGSFMSYYLWMYPPSNVPFNAHEIIDGLWLGDMEAAFNAPELEKRGITHVVTVIIGASPPFPKKFEYRTIQAIDIKQEDLTPYFDDIVEFIHSAISSGGRVFVHCRRGKSRSASFVLAYLMSKHSHSLDDALEFVKQKRPIVRPNPGFINQLKEFESKLSNQKSTDNTTLEDVQ
mmetsp:Transcript_152/g.203  ORF Transcript_152/g.203 Transcript_152/m.203 type:complete len:195 (-) Transcript_152:74-658(-)